jgi:predicted nucleotidyltransferase
MKPSASLRQHLDEVRDAIARYPVRNPKVFGSVARGEDSGKSDLDILVEPEEHASFYAESEARRPVIPTESGHPIRRKAARRSERRRPPCG